MDWKASTRIKGPTCHREFKKMSVNHNPRWSSSIDVQHRRNGGPDGTEATAGIGPISSFKARISHQRKEGRSEAHVGLILGRLQLMMSCRLAMSRLMSRTWKRGRWFLGTRLIHRSKWFLGNRLIHCSRSLSWPMTMKRVASTPRTSTLNLGGAHRGWLIPKKKVVAPASTTTEEAGRWEAEGTLRYVQAYDPSGQDVTC